MMIYNILLTLINYMYIHNSDDDNRDLKTDTTNFLEKKGVDLYFTDNFTNGFKLHDITYFTV